jgi:uncharacterized glyoxalase superfamily protein PhnB
MLSQSLRAGLRVANVPAAIRFYRGLGFEEVGTVPAPGGGPVFAILKQGDSLLLVDALEGMPFPDTERERQLKHGPRGLGVVLGLAVDDLDATYRYCTTAGCTITCEPMEEAWGDRIFSCLDPFGYEWEFSHPIAELSADEGLAAVQAKWFGRTE